MSTRDMKEAASTAFDVIIIGGGIIGTGVARDAAMRGLKAALLEKEDFCYGTSAESTRLIHGGLRYLEMYDFGLVREDLREREILLRIAPHLVFPLPFLLPMYSKGFIYRNKLRMGMILYDVLSFDKSLPNHRFLSRAEALDHAPTLDPRGLQGALLYYDAAAPRTERLCLENALDASLHGATVLNHVEVTGLLREGGRTAGVRAVNRLTGEQIELQAPVVINATGPWMNEAAELLGIRGGEIIRTTKGIHLVSPKVSSDAIVLFAERDGRLYFVIPWLGYSYVGTTDTDYNGDMDTVHATREDVEYLQNAVRAAFPEQDWDTVYYTTAGVRSLMKVEGVSESKVSRKHVILDHGKRDGIPGLFSLVGGKLTAYRGISEDLVDAACKFLGVEASSTTADMPLPGGHTGSFEQYLAMQTEAVGRYPLDAEQIEHLVKLYGSRYTEVADLTLDEPELGERISPAHPDPIAQVVHAVRQEWAFTLRDYMLRRSDIGLLADQGRDAAEPVAQRMAELLGWDQERVGREVRAYHEQIDLGLAYRRENAGVA